MITLTPNAIIFKSLRGEWRLRRVLKSELPGFPSGIFIGRASFIPRKPSAHSVTAELLYAEEGELKTDTGLVLKANRKYIYRYNADEDQISAWFVKEDTKQNDGKEEVDYLFHDVEIKSRASGDRLEGRGEHLCGRDMYWAYYEFCLPNVTDNDDKGMNVFGLRVDALEIIAPFCYHLTITFKPQNGGSDPRTSGSDYTYIGCSISRLSSTHSHQPLSKVTSRGSLQPPQLPNLSQHGQEETMEQWIHIFQHCRQLKTLTFRILGDTAWSGFSSVEKAIVAVRCALDSLGEHDLPHLKTLRIAPATAMSILHLRWDGVAAFGKLRTRRAIKPIHLWQSLETLDLQLHSPFTPAIQMSEHQHIIFLKSLDSYLRSFAPTIQRLHFRWLGGDGPAPLTLHFEEPLRNRPAIIWANLVELRLGGTTQLYHSVCAAKHLAPKLDHISVLLNGTKHMLNNEEGAEMDDAAEGHDVPLVQDRICSRVASSVYSQTTSGQRPSELLSGSISHTSQEVTFMLDLNGRWSQLPPGASLDSPSEIEMVK
ncbi:hypothetical protein M433DRAFT_109288 [Acidomyces richmondensis BFW]|nr:MAG: hypothetical protein FE78DRAFT_169833 [Acidomyces sp. 'richmondensis']KYG44913.1 hypothetical protein M433DRAFT_109288 [Acidomyces richmondensis BFW]